MGDRINNMFYGAAPIIFEQAAALRKHETQAEKVLWNHLSNKKLGVKFRRQHPINQFIVDFYCHEIQLIIEVDGNIHLLKENMEYDKMRTQVFDYYKIKVIRFTNKEVLTQIDKVLAIIKSKMEECKE